MKQVLCIALCLFMCCSFVSLTYAEDMDQRVKALEDKVQEQQKKIETLEQEKKKQENQDTAHPVKEQTNNEKQTTLQELNEKLNQVIEAQKKVLPSEFNPSIGFVGETIFSYNTRPSSETGSSRPGGFDVWQRSMELNAAASVDPFAKAYVVVNASADATTGESSLNVEEAAIQTTSLPGNLEVKAGRFFGEFGRLGYIHDHELPFVNRPLVLAQYIGGESRTDGIQINWLVPMERYVSLTVGAGDQFGGDNPPNFVGDFRNGSGVNYWARLSTYFELTPDISLEPGISGLWNPSTLAQWSPVPANPPLPTVNGNTYTERERRLAGVDMVMSWKPLRDNQFKTITWGTEVLYSDNRYDLTDPSGNALPSRAISSWGLYSYLTYKFHRQWTAGVEYDWLEDIVNNRAETSAYSANITWALSHWNQLRLQYTYTDPNAATGLRSNSAIFLQWAWIIGSHAHGWQQR